MRVENSIASNSYPSIIEIFRIMKDNEILPTVVVAFNFNDLGIFVGVIGIIKIFVGDWPTCEIVAEVSIVNTGSVRPVYGPLD